MRIREESIKYSSKIKRKNDFKKSELVKTIERLEDNDSHNFEEIDKM